METILAPTFIGVDDLALIAAIEPAAADWLPWATEVTQLARANSGGSGMGGGGGAFGGGGGGFGGGGGGSLGGGAFTDVASGSEGSSGLATLTALRGGGGIAADAIPVRSNGSDSGDSSPASRRDDGDANDRNNGNHRSNNSNGGAPRGSGNGPGDPTKVPEPSTMLLMAVGAASLAAKRLRRRGTTS